MKKVKIQRLCVSAVLIALSTVLSMIQVVKMPLGGGLTPLSMLPVILVGFIYGPGAGFSSALIYAVIQLVIGIVADGILGWGLTPGYLAGTVVFDYLLAFSSLGTASLFRKKGTATMCAGIALSLMLRYVCHIVSGTIFFASWAKWDNVIWYSVCYNGAFMLPEIVITTVATAAVINIPYVKRLADRA